MFKKTVPHVAFSDLIFIEKMGVLGGGGFKGLIARNSKKTPNFVYRKYH